MNTTDLLRKAKEYCNNIKDVTGATSDPTNAFVAGAEFMRKKCIESFIHNNNCCNGCSKANTYYCDGCPAIRDFVKGIDN